MSQSLSHRSTSSPLGPLTLVAGSGVLHAVRFATTPAPDRVLTCDADLLDSAVAQLAAYFADATQSFNLPLAPAPTPLADATRQVLARVPPGITLTYTTLAQALNRPNSARALGSVLAANPLLIVVPCHRVVARNGPGGYAAGLTTKRWLLAHEAAS
jgi:methylated-DNA-[protein]-cysteine S-methyltransferase